MVFGGEGQGDKELVGVLHMLKAVCWAVARLLLHLKTNMLSKQIKMNSQTRSTYYPH